MKKTSARAVKAMNMTPDQFWGQNIVKGEVGIEIEVEGANLPMRIAKYWKVVPDGSLRGESAEYVLSQPIKRDSVDDALALLKKTLEDAGSVVNDSYRTSVHVHINHQEMNFRQIINELCLYMIFEDVLIEMCGQDRVGNLFCLRVKDAEHLLESLRGAIVGGDYNYLANNEAFKYGAVNVAALSRYGSLEYRAFRGTVDPDLISEWVGVLTQLKDAALEYDNPQQIVNQFSQMGYQRFVASTFNAYTARFFLNKDNLEARLYEGIRDVQEIAFCIPSWDSVVPAEDPNAKDMYGGASVDNNQWGRFVAELDQQAVAAAPRGARRGAQAVFRGAAGGANIINPINIVIQDDPIDHDFDEDQD